MAGFITDTSTDASLGAPSNYSGASATNVEVAESHSVVLDEQLVELRNIRVIQGGERPQLRAHVTGRFRNGLSGIFTFSGVRYTIVHAKVYRRYYNGREQWHIHARGEPKPDRRPAASRECTHPSASFTRTPSIFNLPQFKCLNGEPIVRRPKLSSAVTTDASQDKASPRSSIYSARFGRPRSQKPTVTPIAEAPSNATEKPVPQAPAKTPARRSIREIRASLFDVLNGLNGE